MDVRDVGVIERGQQLRFAAETGQAVGVVGDRAEQDFDRDVAVQLRIARPIHLAHPPGAEWGEDLIRAHA